MITYVLSHVKCDIIMKRIMNIIEEVQVIKQAKNAVILANYCGVPFMGRALKYLIQKRQY